MTIKLYYVDTEIYEATAKIVNVEMQDDHYAIQLDQTVFHPQGGGQPSDIGTISGVSVAKVVHSSTGEILHLISKECFDEILFGVKQEVKLIIDEKIRNRHAALHTAGHLIDIAISEYQPYNNIFFNPRGNHFPNQSKVTYEYDVINDDVVKASKDNMKCFIENKLSQYIKENLPIIIEVDSDQENRKIQIGDYHPVGCGGTHVKSTRYLNNFYIRNIKAKKCQLSIGYDCEYLRKVIG